MLVDRYQAEDVFARVPEVAAQTDPVLKALDVLLEDDQLYRQVRADLGKRYRLTLVHGRHSTPPAAPQAPGRHRTGVCAVCCSLPPSPQ